MNLKFRHFCWGLSLMLMTVWMGPAAFAEARFSNVGFITAAGGLGDDAYTDMTYHGIRKAQQNYGFKLKIEQPDSTGTVSVSIVEEQFKESDLLIFLGSQHSTVADEIARQYPGKIIVNIGEPLSGQPNVLSVVFRHREGAFLAGALAGWMTRTKTVGFIGATGLDVIFQFCSAFSDGVAYADKNVLVRAGFIMPGADPSGFTKPQKGCAMAVEWYRDDVDIIFSVAGPSGLGVIHAARMEKKYAIGVDTDQDHMAKGYVLTSMMKRTDRAVHNELCKIMDGQFSPGVVYYGLKEGGVELSPMTYTRHLVPDTVLDRLAETEQKIISGEIRIASRN